MSTVHDVHRYWRHPDTDNEPATYLVDRQPRSEFVAAVLSTVAAADPSVIEFGCNAGANLAALADAGFERLSGVDINPDAIALARNTFPQLRAATLTTSALELYAAGMDDYDIGFSLAVFEHIHPISEWVFRDIAVHCRHLLTIEDERNTTPRHFPRNYQQVFEPLGHQQIDRWDGLAAIGLDGAFVARLFRRVSR